MINKQVTIDRIQTMVDGSFRLTITILGGDADDFKEAFRMKETETTMLITPTEKFVDAITVVANDLVKNAETH
jgi:hypothetical protein